MVPRDTLSDNIVSYLLLTSDLKGHIEAPGSYSRETPEHIDLLMLTHGWTRYEIGKFLTATPSKATFKLEQRQEIRGKITNYSNKPMANASVQIFIPGENTLGEVKSNENGEFIIRDLDFPDSTIFLVRGYKEKGGKMVDITITPRLFKDPVTHFTIPRENKPLGKEEFMDQFKGSYFYQNGVKVYILDEAVVLRHRPESVQHKYEGQYTDMTDYILGQEELNKFNTSSIYQLLSRLPGVIVSGTKVTMARNGSTPLFMIDGLPQTEDMLNAVMPEDVDNLGVIRDGARLTFFMAQGGAGGVIVINTKHGHFTPKATPGLIKFIPLGTPNRMNSTCPNTTTRKYSKLPKSITAARFIGNRSSRSIHPGRLPSLFSLPTWPAVIPSPSKDWGKTGNRYTGKRQSGGNDKEPRIQN